MIEVSQISLSNLNKFAHFLPYAPTESNFWLGASINGTVVGVLLSSIEKNDTTTCNLDYLFIHPAMRREGVATHLFNAFNKHYKEKGYKKIFFNAVASKDEFENLNYFLKSFGYKTPEIVARIYTFDDPKSIVESKLIKEVLNSKLSTPKFIEILPLNEVNSKLINEVNKKIDIDFPAHYALYPTNICSNLKHINTFVAVANKKEIVGWLVALDIFGKSIYYKTFYVKEEYRKYAIGFFLISACVKAHAKKYFNIPALCGISLKNPDAEKFNSTYFKGANKTIKYEFILKSDL